jgi:hypothetical protein
MRAAKVNPKRHIRLALAPPCYEHEAAPVLVEGTIPPESKRGRRFAVFCYRLHASHSFVSRATHACFPLPSLPLLYVSTIQHSCCFVYRFKCHDFHFDISNNNPFEGCFACFRSPHSSAKEWQGYLDKVCCQRQPGGLHHGGLPVPKRPQERS